MSGSSENNSPGGDKAKVISITGELNRLRDDFEREDWKNRGIYRVPRGLKVGGDDSVFRPRFVSIGPYHHGDPNLQCMQYHKYWVLHYILKSSGKDLGELLDVVKNLEHRAGACYEDLPQMRFPGETFAEMLLLDACFILYHLNLLPFTELERDSSPIFSNAYLILGITMDMILLENQVPLFILNGIHEVLCDRPPGGNEVVMRSICEGVNSSFVLGRELTAHERFSCFISSLKLPTNIGHDMLSLLEVFWHSLVCDSITQQCTGKMEKERGVQSKVVDIRQFIIPSVTVLKEAGVKLRHKNAISFWDIVFKAGVLEIPQIMIYEASESLFVNLMALELRHLDHGRCKITSYIACMDSLVNTASDVAYLRQRGIIVCAGPSNEQVASLFNRLGKRVIVPFDQLAPSDQFMQLSRQINEYCNRRWPKWRAILIRNYFKNPWTIISVITAALLVLLTIIQTYYTVAQYYQR